MKLKLLITNTICLTIQAKIGRMGYLWLMKQNDRIWGIDPNKKI